MAPVLRRAAVALFAVPLTLAGCLGPRGMGPGVPWTRSHLVLPSAPPAVTSTYEHTPELEWRRFAIGQAYSPAASLFGPPGPMACRRMAQGITGVSTGGAPAPPLDLRSTGVSGTGVGGLPVLNAFHLLMWSHENVAGTMVSSAAGLSNGADACAMNVFAYVRLGLGSSLDPVTVVR